MDNSLMNLYLRNPHKLRGSDIDVMELFYWDNSNGNRKLNEDKRKKRLKSGQLCCRYHTCNVHVSFASQL